jgi:hypothetical protein
VEKLAPSAARSPSWSAAMQKRRSGETLDAMGNPNGDSHGESGAGQVCKTRNQMVTGICRRLGALPARQSGVDARQSGRYARRLCRAACSRCTENASTGNYKPDSARVCMRRTTGSSQRRWRSIIVRRRSALSFSNWWSRSSRQAEAKKTTQRSRRCSSSSRVSIPRLLRPLPHRANSRADLVLVHRLPGPPRGTRPMPGGGSRAPGEARGRMRRRAAGCAWQSPT